MGLNFHHPGVDHIMPLNSESHFIHRIIILTPWNFQPLFGICRCVCGCQHRQTYHNDRICLIILRSVRCKKNPQMDDNSSDS